MKKKCSECKKKKKLSDFGKSSESKDGLRYQCRECNKKRCLKYRNKSTTKKKQKLYYQNNKDKILSYQNKFWHDHKEERKEDRRAHWREYNQKIRKENAIVKLANNIGNLIRQSFKRRGYTKVSRLHIILGTDFKTLKIHIENQFKPGMAWQNHGEWHIDHRTPLATAKSKEEIIKLNHYTNLQPLWAVDNLKKGAKIIV